jgi:hypothetical protein
VAGLNGIAVAVAGSATGPRVQVPAHGGRRSAAHFDLDGACASPSAPTTVVVGTTVVAGTPAVVDPPAVGPVDSVPARSGEPDAANAAPDAAATGGFAVGFAVDSPPEAPQEASTRLAAASAGHTRDARIILSPSLRPNRHFT